ncbi:hypothetical protein VP1G_06252 [Cytospora mali]|uniref:RanBP2-type domain-containing protein n=1 Tax=Cytospora mali TaxID=578113 RepID=A0A194V4W6_CYTMA|nr:hypothetical protein VP1G_06252 [Valsa mali var. pyri (nom. inval.)]
MNDQRSTHQGTLPNVRPTPNTPAFNATRLVPTSTFVAKIPIRRADGTIEYQLSWIVPAEHTERYIQCSECSFPNHHSIETCQLCGVPRGSQIVPQTPIRHELPAALGTESRQDSGAQQPIIGLHTPVQYTVIAAILFFVCGVVRSPVPIFLALGLILLLKLGFFPQLTNSPQTPARAG